MNDNTVISVLEFDEQIQAYFLVLSVQLHGFGNPAPTHTHTHTHTHTPFKVTLLTD